MWSNDHNKPRKSSATSYSQPSFFRSQATPSVCQHPALYISIWYTLCQHLASPVIKGRKGRKFSKPYLEMTSLLIKQWHSLVAFVQFKKREQHQWRSVTFSKVAACNFTKSNNPPWVFFTFFKLCNWYQIAQRITFYCGKNKKCPLWVFSIFNESIQ